MQRTQSSFALSGFVAALAFTTACGGVPPDGRTYEVRSGGDWTTSTNGPITETQGSVLVGDKRVEIKVRSDARKGPGFVETESFDFRHQKVVVEHDMAKKIMKVTVGGDGAMEIAQSEDGLFRYGRNSYKDDRSEQRQLAQVVAGDLIDRGTDDESIVAQHALAKALTGRSALSRAHGLDSGKLFFAFAFVDVFAQVQNQMGIAIGNDISQDFNNW